MADPHPAAGATVLGADGCPGGWVVAQAGPGGLRWHEAADMRALLALARRVGAAAVAADVPIGLPRQGVPGLRRARPGPPGRPGGVVGVRRARPRGARSSDVRRGPPAAAVAVGPDLRAGAAHPRRGRGAARGGRARPGRGVPPRGELPRADRRGAGAQEVGAGRPAAAARARGGVRAAAGRPAGRRGPGRRARRARLCLDGRAAGARRCTRCSAATSTRPACPCASSSEPAQPGPDGRPARARRPGRPSARAAVRRWAVRTPPPDSPAAVCGGAQSNSGPSVRVRFSS